MTSIRDLLDDGSLHLRLVVPGDIDQHLSWVHVTEIADAADYLAGRELVMTTGVWRRQRIQASTFVGSLSRKAVAGIAYGLLQGDERIPIGLVRACQDWGVPLLEVPVRTPFIAISQAFVARWSAEREASLRQSMQLTTALLEAANDSDPARALDGVAATLAQAIGAETWVSDGQGRLLASSHALAHPERIREWVRMLGAETTIVDGWFLLPLDDDGKRTSIIGACTDAADLEVRSRVESARPIVGLVLAREQAVLETERRLAGEVISMILGRQVDAAAARMPYYGLDPSARFAPMVASVADREHALPAAELWLQEQGVAGVIGLRGPELMVIIAANDLPPADPEATAKAFVPVAASLGTCVGATGVGIGSIAEGVDGLRRSLVQARHACERARQRGSGAVVAHDLIASHELLLALQDQDVLDSFRDNLLAPIERHDEASGGDLMKTLRAFLESGGRWQDTARLLHVHVNTLRHRIERIEQLTGRQLDATADRVDLWLALQSSAIGTPGRIGPRPSS